MIEIYLKDKHRFKNYSLEKDEVEYRLMHHPYGLDYKASLTVWHQDDSEACYNYATVYFNEIFDL